MVAPAAADTPHPVSSFALSPLHLSSQQQSSGPPRRHVLLVEDEPTLSRVLSMVLTNAGYDVSCCADGAEALRVFRASPDAVHVVVSDVTMPVLSGDRLARALHEIRPRLPVILMTGFSHTVTPENALGLGVAAVLQKPVSIDDLVAAVDAVTERGRLEA
jgi:DNA-binding response OmpR family regulator